MVSGSIGTKLTLATLSVLLVVSAVLYFELSRRERESILGAKRTAAVMVSDLFAASMGAPLDFADNDAISSELKHLETNPDVICAEVFLHDEPSPIAKIDRECGAREKVEIWNDVHGRENAVVGHTRVLFSLARENAAVAASKRRIFWFAFALALGTAGVLLAVSRTQIIGPLRRLSAAAKRVGGGDFTTRVRIRSKDEMADLATAFNRMSEEIGDRERRLEAVTTNLRELFDHMGQAIVAFDRDGKVRGEVSREATNVFHTRELEGRPIASLLYGEKSVDVDAQAFAEWQQMAFEVPLDGWQQLADLAPKETAIADVALELEFRPIAKEGALDRVMMLATDVTEKKRLEQAIDTAEAEHKRRMNAMRRLVASGAQLFVQFLASTEARFRSTKDRAELFRHVHTAKGEARAFELTALEEVLEGIETALQAGDAVDLEPALEALARAREDFVEVSPVGRTALDLVTVRRGDLEAVLEVAKRSQDRNLTEAASRLAARPFGESMATIAERAPEWAARDRKAVELLVEGKEVPIPPGLAAVLGGVLAHLVRNAIAHGIETEEARAAGGKEPVGSVWASAVEGANGPTVTVEDDGAGIDADAVREKARAMGLSGDPLELVFRAGLSTRETADGLAGRGIGLDAVRSYLREVGYGIALVTERGNGTKFVLAPEEEG